MREREHIGGRRALCGVEAPSEHGRGHGACGCIKGAVVQAARGGRWRPAAAVAAAAAAALRAPAAAVVAAAAHVCSRARRAR